MCFIEIHEYIYHKNSNWLDIHLLTGNHLLNVYVYYYIKNDKQIIIHKVQLHIMTYLFHNVQYNSRVLL